jgi:hypothetical protein
MTDISDDKLNEILAGTEGVTPGPWVSEGSRSAEEPDAGCAVIASNADHEVSNPSRGMVLWANGFRAECVNNAAHVARLDPDTVKAIVTELLALRHQSSEGARSDWVRCPICGEPDMHKTTDRDGNVLIECVNHNCASNEGHNGALLAATLAKAISSVIEDALTSPDGDKP